MKRSRCSSMSVFLRILVEAAAGRSSEVQSACNLASTCDARTATPAPANTSLPAIWPSKSFRSPGVTCGLPRVVRAVPACLLRCALLRCRKDDQTESHNQGRRALCVNVDSRSDTLSGWSREKMLFKHTQLRRCAGVRPPAAQMQVRLRYCSSATATRAAFQHHLKTHCSPHKLTWPCQRCSVDSNWT
jgi:hypothetical protein